MRFLITASIFSIVTTTIFSSGDRQAFAAAPTSMPTASQIGVAPSNVVQPECTMVCADIKKKLKADSKKVETDLERWQQRLGVKTDIVRYDEGYSAAEELMRFMVTHYRLKGQGGQMEPAFLIYMMMKCFPEAHVDQTHARMSKLVETLWVAKHLQVEKSIATCK